MFDTENFVEKLPAMEALRPGDTVKRDTVDRIKPEFAESWLDDIRSSLRRALEAIDIRRPSVHQVEAVSRSLSGLDAVMESPTASGKTLAFAVPMLDTIVRNRGSHALMIYPMKALAFDQRERLRQLCAPVGVQSWPYDGDTPSEHRNAMRQKPPQILLTNPEYLNMSFFAWRDKWTTFLQRLLFVVIVEMHEYRGFFGGNVPLLLRRFFFQLERIGSRPRVFL